MPLMNSNQPAAVLSNVIYTGGAQQVQRANTFTPAVNYNLEWIIVDLDDPFNACVNVIAEIFLADGSNLPTGAALASVTVLQDLIPLNHATVTFTLASSLAVTTGVELCLVLRSDAPDAANAARWFSGFANTGLASSSTDGGSTWGLDGVLPGYYFEIWGTEGGFAPPVNQPVLRRLCACASDIFWYEDI